MLVPRGCDQGPARDRRRQKSNPLVYSADAPTRRRRCGCCRYGSQHRKMAKQIYENPVSPSINRPAASHRQRTRLQDRRLVLDDAGPTAVSRRRSPSTPSRALADTLRHFGTEPGVLVPHSMERRPAAYFGRTLAGGRGRVICHRSRLMAEGGGADRRGPSARGRILGRRHQERAGGLPDWRSACTPPAHGDRRSAEPSRDRRARRGGAKIGCKLRQTKGHSHTCQVEPILSANWLRSPESHRRLAASTAPPGGVLLSGRQGDPTRSNTSSGSALFGVVCFRRSRKPLRWATVRSLSRTGCAHLRRGYHVRCGYPERRTHRRCVARTSFSLGQRWMKL